MASTKRKQFAVPDHIDEAAQSIPNDTWAVVPRSTTGLDKGWHHLTFADLAKAVNKLARWIEKILGVAKYQNQTIGYMGANDLGYIVVLAATLKTGYLPLFTSPRNSLDGQIFLLRETNCKIFLNTDETAPQVKKIREAEPNVEVFQAPSIQDLLDLDCSASHYAGRHSRDAKAHSLILHTSGSTGK